MPLGLGVLCHHSMGLLNGDYFQVVDVLGAGKRWRPRTSAARSGRAGPGRVDGRGEREDGAAPDWPWSLFECGEKGEVFELLRESKRQTHPATDAMLTHAVSQPDAHMPSLQTSIAKALRRCANRL